MSRILLLLDHKENRRLLAEWLATQHEVVAGASDARLSEAFDLCLVDGHALDRLQGQIQARKLTEHPVFLPVLAVTSRHGVSMITRHLWECVDELITSPIEKAELQVRVEILLRARRLSWENAALGNQLEAELQRAALVQAELLPHEPPALRNFEIAARSMPAREVGGDFYDWIRTGSDTVALTVGDAMGQGMSAALLMATVRAALRALIQRHRPAAALELVRAGLESDFINAGFVTLFHAQLTESTRQLRFVDAGHAHLFVLHKNGEVENLHPRCAALGIPLHKPFVEGLHTFTPGEALVVYTDGILDAQPDLALDHLALARELQNATTAREMVERLLRFGMNGHTQPDDVTVAVLRCVT